MKNKNKYLLITIILVFTLLTVMVINLNANSKEYIVGDTDSSIMQDESIAEDAEEENYEQEENSKVTVFVSGEVLNQRVVEIEKGKRLIDAVEICGGLTENADLNAVNLALVLEEEGHYIIPAIGDTNVLNATNLNQMNSSSNLVNINSADIELLKTNGFKSLSTTVKSGALSPTFISFPSKVIELPFIVTIFCLLFIIIFPSLFIWLNA